MIFKHFENFLRISQISQNCVLGYNLKQKKNDFQKKGKKLKIPQNEIAFIDNEIVSYPHFTDMLTIRHIFDEKWVWGFPETIFVD